MKSYEVNRLINAEPAVVWAVLGNPQALVNADTGIERIDGQIGARERFVLKAEMMDRSFKIKVTSFEPEKLMVWESGMPLGMFKGVRSFVLNPQNAGTEFQMREEFTGAMPPVIWKSMPDLQPSFEQFADAIKQHSEASSG